MINHGHITWGRPQKHDVGLIWASVGLQRPRRPNQTDNSRNKSCIGQIGAVCKRVLVFGGGKGPSSGYKIQKISKHFKKKRFLFFLFFVLLHRVPSATGTRNILCCRRGLWERCSEPISDKSRSYHLGTSPKTRFRAHLGLCGPPELSRGQTRQRMIGMKVVYGILEQVGSVF